MNIDPGTRPDLWAGALHWESQDGWWQPSRLRPEFERHAYAPPLYERARVTAGVRLEVRTDARALVAQVTVPPGASAVIDLVIDGRLDRRVPVGSSSEAITCDLPSGCHDVEVWLPHNHPSEVGRVTVEGASVVETLRAHRQRWIAYGSSITQCAASLGPTETWPALVARELDLDLTCLGFGAQAHLDGAIVRTMETLDAELITLCLGINVYGQNSFGQRTWAGHVADFIARIREGHPEAGIVVISPIGCPAREEVANASGLTLAGIRGDVERVVHDLQAAGDHGLVGLSGLELLSIEECDLLTDGLHPGPEGYRLIAARMSRALLSLGWDLVPRVAG